MGSSLFHPLNPLTLDRLERKERDSGKETGRVISDYFLSTDITDSWGKSDLCCQDIWFLLVHLHTQTTKQTATRNDSDQQPTSLHLWGPSIYTLKRSQNSNSHTSEDTILSAASKSQAAAVGSLKEPHVPQQD